MQRKYAIILNFRPPSDGHDAEGGDRAGRVHGHQGGQRAVDDRPIVHSGWLRDVDDSGDVLQTARLHDPFNRGRDNGIRPRRERQQGYRLGQTHQHLHVLDPLSSASGNRSAHHLLPPRPPRPQKGM